MKKKNKLITFEKKQTKQKRDITTTFKSLGFQYLNTENKHKIFGVIKSDIDAVFLYENIILICEISLDSYVKNHLLKTGRYFGEINKEKDELIEWLKKYYSDKFNLFTDYPLSRYKIKFLYINEYTVAEEKQTYYNTNEFKISFLDEKELKYFKKLATAIKHSGRYELFKFLDLTVKEIGISKSEKNEPGIDSAVILPEMNSGFPSDIRIVSFLMSAEQLLQCAYVSRKDNWEKKLELYQRLIEPSRITKIREFIAKEQKSFINNIVVSLPDSVSFYEKLPDNEERLVDVFSVDEIKNLIIKFPVVFNSIGIIDGQHRLYAHYEADNKEKFEKIIKNLRNRIYLLVTGLVFNKSMKKADKANIESQLFLEINDNQKKVPAINLMTIISLKAPYSPISISLQVLNELNKKTLFLNYFKLSSFSPGKIRIPSLIRWGLKDLLEISNEKETLFKYWDNDNKLKLFDEECEDFEELFKEYINFCVNSLTKYFSAIKTVFYGDWTSEDKNNRFFTVTSMTGFIIALKKSLSKYGLKENQFYVEKLQSLNIKFNKEDFPYKSSHWTPFAEKIDEECWD